MLTSELSSYLLEIPNDAYTLLSQALIDCSLLSQEYCKLIGGCKIIMKWQLLVYSTHLYISTVHTFASKSSGGHACLLFVTNGPFSFSRWNVFFVFMLSLRRFSWCSLSLVLSRVSRKYMVSSSLACTSFYQNTRNKTRWLKVQSITTQNPFDSKEFHLEWNIIMTTHHEAEKNIMHNLY